MKKDDLAWLIVRATGVFLIIRLFLYLPAFLTSLTWMVAFDANPSSDVGEMMSAFRTQIGSSAIATLLCGVFGLYLLRRGQFVFKLLTFVSPVLLSKRSTGRANTARR